MEKKLTNSGPFLESASKHSIYTHTVEELRLALHEFQRQYNETWLIGRHGYKTPAQVRHAQRCALADAA
jgi:hypothetical protein